jgi:hypothetical protein
MGICDAKLPLSNFLRKQKSIRFCPVVRELRSMKLSASATVFCMVWLASTVAADGLIQLKYNNPGLTVDLGVGLWAWPVPCDADGDGDFDLIVSSPDKPSNGIWLFENVTGDTAVLKMPIFKP